MNTDKNLPNSTASLPSSLEEAPMLSSSALLTTARRLMVAMMAILALGACAEDPVTRVQTNLVSKDIFQGEWWVLETVVAADGDATEIGRSASFYVFPGGSGWTDYALDSGQSPVIGKIRWVVDQDFLFAYRSYELIDGGNDDGRDDDFRGQPLAAFRIEDHVDVRRDYSGITGERTNVTIENTSDQRWYEREFMRVDWSTNHVQSFSFLGDHIDLTNMWRRESVPFDIQEDAHQDFPEHFAPQFVRIGEDEDYRFRHEWPEGTEDTVHYMSFTTQTMISPGDNCLYVGGGVCQTLSVPMRLAFLRVPPEHEFASQTESHEQFDRFGLFRTYQRSYVRGGTRPISCQTDVDCGGNGFCDLTRTEGEGGYCSGLSSDLGETDFLTFYRPQHNFFRNALTDQACLVDWECDVAGGSTCDRAARRCTTPVREREINQVVYHLNDGFPAHLTKAAFEVMGNWNEVFMRGYRAAMGRSLPDYGVGSISCQNDDPTAYCFCGSAEDRGGSCKTEFDPFVSPDEWASMGVEEPFQCQIVNVDGWDEPAQPESYDEYSIPSAYRWEFQGEECMFLLETNTCDWWRTDADASCNDVVDDMDQEIAWQQQGDIRYQFFNYIDQVGTGFGGVSEIRLDPTNGELITADANFSGVVTESVVRNAVEFFPALRCQNPDLGCEPGEEGADERYLRGANLRDYFANLGYVEHPRTIAPSGDDGTGDTENLERPDLPSSAPGLSDAIMDRVMDVLPRIEDLRGEGARANIFSDRMRDLKGTAIESRLMEGLGRQAMQAHFGNTTDPMQVTDLPQNASVTDEGVMDRVSPFRGNQFMREMTRERRLQHELGMQGACFFDLEDSFQRARYWEYWAEAFRGRSLGEASIRIQQAMLRSVQHHEVGHSVGLRHNFGASFDRNNYGDGYFYLAVEDGLDLPQVDDYNTDDDNYIEETDQYYRDLRDTRNARAKAGIHNYMTGSIMDYNGDLSDISGLGRYDKGAVMWSYFNQIEAFVGDPREDQTDPFSRQLSHEYNRTLLTNYEGGESCSETVECPYAFGSSLLSEGQPVHQRCIEHPRNTRLPEECRPGSTDCICSSYSEDMKDYVDGFYYNNDLDGDLERDLYPVKYLFCSDARTVDISWCSTGDAGESFQEAIDHYRRSWYEGYANNYFRQFRGVRTGASIGSIIDTAKIYQHFFFRYFYEPGFTSNLGPLGINDQVFASQDGMHWLMEMANLPDEGSYAFNPNTNTYEHMGNDLAMAGSDISLDTGLGFQMWSEFQDGHQGFFRTERGGVFYDKYFALLALAIRDWGLSFTIDERYFINYYDLFPIPMTEFFGGIITDQPRWYAPRWMETEEGERRVQHMTFERGLLFGGCTVNGVRNQPCRGSNEELYPEPALGGTSNVILRSWATILALAQFPVFYDSSFEQRLIIFKRGTGVGFDLPDQRRDGTANCPYGDFLVESAGTACAGPVSDPEEAGYAAFHSDRLNQDYVAVKVEPRDTYNLEIEQLGFQTLRPLIDMQNRIREIDALGAGASPAELAERSDLREKLTDGESYLEYLIDLQAQYGISNYFF